MVTQVNNSNNGVVPGLILTEFNSPYSIPSINSPIVPDYYWSFSSILLDYILNPILFVETSTGQAITLSIEGVQITVPTDWNIMVVEPSSRRVDVVPVMQCAKHNFNAFLFCPDDTKYRHRQIRVVEVIDHTSVVFPSHDKDTMICMPIGLSAENTPSHLAVCVGAYDVAAAKHFPDEVHIGDLLYG